MMDIVIASTDIMSGDLHIFPLDTWLSLDAVHDDKQGKEVSHFKRDIDLCIDESEPLFCITTYDKPYSDVLFDGKYYNCCQTLDALRYMLEYCVSHCKDGALGGFCVSLYQCYTRTPVKFKSQVSFTVSPTLDMGGTFEIRGIVDDKLSSLIDTLLRIYTDCCIDVKEVYVK